MATPGVIRFSKCYTVCASNSDLKDNLSNINPPRSQGVSRGRRGAGRGVGWTVMDSVAGVLPGASVITPLLTDGDCPTVINKCNA